MSHLREAANLIIEQLTDTEFRGTKLSDAALLLAREWIREHPTDDTCEHGVMAGNWCAPCNREYKEAFSAEREDVTR